MPTTTVTSPHTPEQVIRRMMTLCPGGAVGVVMRKEGRLLLPRLMPIQRVVIERRGRGVQPGRIVLFLSPVDSGTSVTITSAVHPIALLVSVTFIAAIASAVGWFAGAIAGVAVAAVFSGAQAMWWRKSAAATAADAAWLAKELASAPSAPPRVPA